MKSLKKVIIDGKTFFKTTKSPKNKYCVGVAIDNEEVTIVNTKEKKTTIKFSKKEWDAFVVGIKEGHFDSL